MTSDNIKPLLKIALTPINLTTMKTNKLNYAAYGFTPRQKTKKAFQIPKPLQAVENVPPNYETETPLTPLNAFDSAVTLPFWRNEELELDNWLGSAIEWD